MKKYEIECRIYNVLYWLLSINITNWTYDYDCINIINKTWDCDSINIINRMCNYDLVGIINRIWDCDSVNIINRICDCFDSINGKAIKINNCQGLLFWGVLGKLCSSLLPYGCS